MTTANTERERKTKHTVTIAKTCNQLRGVHLAIYKCNPVGESLPMSCLPFNHFTSLPLNNKIVRFHQAVSFFMVFHFCCCCVLSLLRLMEVMRCQCDWMKNGMDRVFVHKTLCTCNEKPRIKALISSISPMLTNWVIFFTNFSMICCCCRFFISFRACIFSFHLFVWPATVTVHTACYAICNDGCDNRREKRFWHEFDWVSTFLLCCVLFCPSLSLRCSLCFFLSRI